MIDRQLFILDLFIEVPSFQSKGKLACFSSVFFLFIGSFPLIVYVGPCFPSCAEGSLACN